MPRLFVLVDLAGIEQALQNSLDDFLVSVPRCFSPFIISDVEFLPEIDKFLCDAFDKFSWRNTGFRRGLLHFLAVLIDTGQKENFLSLEPVVTRDHIGQDLLVSVPYMRRRVCVINRRCDKKRFRHFAITSVAAVCACRKQGPCSPVFSLAFVIVENEIDG